MTDPIRITDLRVTPVFVPIKAPLVYSQGTHPGFSRLIVEIDTDAGITGLGECYSGAARAGQLTEFRSALIGEDPMRLERLRWKLGSPAALKLFGQVLPYAAVEFALLDIQGKALGVSVSQLLGGALRERIDTCGYLFYRRANGDGEGAVEDADGLCRFAADLIDEYGFRSIKYKNGVKHPDEEIETALALRARFPGHRLRIDPNAVWSVATATRVARRLRDCDLEYLEDPTWGMRGLSRVNAKVPWIALASNMAVFGVDDLLPAIQSDVVDVVLLDPHWYGGLSRARFAGQVCELADVDVGMHSGAELGISLAAMLHLAAVLPNLAVAIDTHYHHLVDDVIVGGLMPIEDGAIPVPTEPGLGVTLDPDRVARYAELAATQSMGGWTDHGDADGHVTVTPKW